MFYFKNEKRKLGFTLIEFVVVIAILSIIGVVISSRFIGKTDEARISRNIANVKSIEKAVNLYKVDKGTFPTIDKQPIEGTPEKIDFSLLVPDYLDRSPYENYQVDYLGKVSPYKDIITFIDSNLKNLLIAQGVDIDGDLEITITEAEQITGEIVISGQGITNLSGIEYFNNMTSFNMANNNVESIEPLGVLMKENNGKLQNLDTSGNPLYNFLTAGATHRVELDFMIGMRLYPIWVIE